MFNTITKPLLMGILNVTPNSFSDGGQFVSLDNAVAQAQQMHIDGADILDIGGEATNPGAEPVSAQVQIERVVPVIKAIREQLGTEVLISIDTTSHLVAAAALDAGANIINDISAGSHDPDMFPLTAARAVPIILMHMQGTPKTMQENPYYVDVVGEVLDFVQKRAFAAIHAGIKVHNIALDPGIGFGKRKIDNLRLLANLQLFADSGYPVLLGTSRKRFMGTICMVNSPTELVTATAATTALGVMAGVKMFRVHDVLENRQALDVAWAIKTADE